MAILSLPQIASYISYALIIALYAVKVTKIVRMPPHLRWELYPIAAGKNKPGGSYLEELVVNAMVDLKEPFIQWEWH